VRNTAAQVTSMAVVVATGITATGEREVLGLDVGDSEDEVFWRQFLRSLKSRGLSGMRLVISDQHAGLVAALKRSFQGSTHQRCRVHFSRNLLALVPKSHKDMVAAVFRTIFAQPDPDTAAATWDDVRSHPHRRVALGDACLVPLDRGQSDARRSRRQRTFTQLQWPRPTDRHGRFGTT
jgi:transposase-like protein